jgi:hypothetical protein
MVLADSVSHQTPHGCPARRSRCPPARQSYLPAALVSRRTPIVWESNRARRCYVTSCVRYDGSAAGVVQLCGRVEAGLTIRTESRIAIAGSVREVWAYVCDVGRWPEWAPTVLECWVGGGGPLQPGSRVEQRAKDLGRTHARIQEVTAVEPPRHVAFAGRMGTSAARWGMELEPVADSQTDAMMWIEVDLAGFMRAIPGLLKGSIQRVSDREMAAIKAAVESATHAGAES